MIAAKDALVGIITVITSLFSHLFVAHSQQIQSALVTAEAIRQLIWTWIKSRQNTTQIILMTETSPLPISDDDL